MQYTTWGDFKTKVEKEHDIQEDPDFLSSGELSDILNDAIDKCEQHFIKIPGYFTASTTISVVAGQRDYDLPDDIYGTKIQNLVHTTEFYEVKRLKSLKDRQFQERAVGAEFRYLLINNAGSPIKLRLYPTPVSPCTLEMEYIRNATRIDGDGADSQEIDVPEAMGFIYKYTEWRLRKKEKIQTEIDRAANELKEELQDLKDALAELTDDGNNEIEPDVDLVLEHM